MRLLFIESDPTMTLHVRQTLAESRVCTEVRSSGKAGIDRAKSSTYDLILLNLNLPDMSGHEVLQNLRGSKVDTPVVILASSDVLQDKLAAYGAGVDDFLVAPFHKEELVARIRAIIRRSRGHMQSTIYTGQLAVNLHNKAVEIRGRPLHVTTMEYQILELLSLRKGTPLSKELLSNHLYRGVDAPGLRILLVFISRLRRKIAQANDGESYIETVPGQGYMLRDPMSARQEYLEVPSVT